MAYDTLWTFLLKKKGKGGFQTVGLQGLMKFCISYINLYISCIFWQSVRLGMYVCMNNETDTK